MPKDKSGLDVGIEIEVEHKPTVEMIREYLAETGELPPDEEIYKSIAQDHINENELYYDVEVGLPNWEKELSTILQESQGGDIEITPIAHPESTEETSLVYIAHKINAGLKNDASNLLRKFVSDFKKLIDKL